MSVTRPERPKGAKDEVKRLEGPPPRSQGLEGPYTSIGYNPSCASASASAVLDSFFYCQQQTGLEWTKIKL